MQKLIPAEEGSQGPAMNATPLRLSCETRVLNGRYRLRRPIRRGHVADVYLGDDLLLERVVVIKIPHLSVVEDASRMERFRREAVSLATVRSPYIVGVYDIGLTNDCAYLVMQHIEGRTIEEEIRRFGPMTEVRAATVLTQLLAGLAAMHGQGLVSRDVSSSNVLLDRCDKVVLVDLGIVLDTRRGLSTVVGKGTPDSARGGSFEDEFMGDVYQVGLILLFLLTGLDPRRRSPRAGFEDLFQRLSLAFASVARRALATDPSERFPSAVVMKENVDTALQTSTAYEPIYVRPPRSDHPLVGDLRPTVTMTAAHLLSLLTDTGPTATPAKARVEGEIKTRELEAEQILSVSPLGDPTDRGPDPHRRRGQGR